MYGKEHLRQGRQVLVHTLSRLSDHGLPFKRAVPQASFCKRYLVGRMCFRGEGKRRGEENMVQHPKPPSPAPSDIIQHTFHHQKGVTHLCEN